MQSLIWPPKYSSLDEQSKPASTQKQDEMTQAESHSLDIQNSVSNSVSNSDPLFLQGHLQVRKGRFSGQSSWVWKRRCVVFSFEHGGSFSIYREDKSVSSTRSSKHQPASVLRTVYSKLQRGISPRDESKANGNLVLTIASDLPWIAKDVEKDPTTFVVEIATEDSKTDTLLQSRHSTIFEDEEAEGNFLSDDDNDDDYGSSMSDNGGTVCLEDKASGVDDLAQDLRIAKASGKPLRIYFRCDVSSNEKALWLKAFSKCGRLSVDLRKKKTMLSSLTSTIHWGSSRTRSIANERIAHDTRQLDSSEDQFDLGTADLTNHVEFLARGKGTGRDKEFRVLPSYAYPHRWLTKEEMREEMVLPSEYFHDLRVPGCKDKQIGSLKVEVLQCLGLPKLDRVTDSNSVVYLVCGSYAFSTDVIYNRTNPMWLRKTRRACVFPLFHGYARLYAGVFDDDSRKVKDDFAGRVVIDLARLRPRSTYDVTLPLRLSTHVYSRRKRGALRLRFTLNWHSERDALLSYLPDTLKIPLPQHTTPNCKTTVLCSDQKAFRNIAITVHGAHLPGRFTFNQMRAAIREINFTRKSVFTALRRNFRETRQWQNPAMSAFVFLSWMHCIFANAFSLVPAYVMLYFLLLLMRNYAKYSIDGPGVRGFIPPTWEELFMALVRGSDPNFHAIEPLELGLRPSPLSRRRSPESIIRSGNDPGRISQYKVNTHNPKGKSLLRALDFLPEGQVDPNDDHLEFPFADGKDYPKFTVEECLVTQGKSTFRRPSGSGSFFDENNSTALSNITDDDHRSRVMPRFPIDMDLQRMMRKDSSGTRDYDEEEDNFAARRAVISQGRKAASKMTKTATALSSKTGLDYVVKPLHYGISSGVSHVSSGVGHVSSVAGSMTSHVISMPSEMRRRASMDMHRNDDFIADSHFGAEGDSSRAEAAVRQRRRSSVGVGDFSRCTGDVDRPQRRGSNGADLSRYTADPDSPHRRRSSGAELARYSGDIETPRRSGSNCVDFSHYHVDPSITRRRGSNGAGLASHSCLPGRPVIDSASEIYGYNVDSDVHRRRSLSDTDAGFPRYSDGMGIAHQSEASQYSSGVDIQRSDFYGHNASNDVSQLEEFALFGASNGSGQSEFDPLYDDYDPNDSEIDLDESEESEEIDPALIFPEQNIDIQGPSNGKKLTDDLAEIKDKMHELTWHLFDDQTYVIKNPNALFFGESTKPSKRKKSDPTKKLDKYLHMGQYSHSNPFVARVGMYVEPIIGSSYSILCLFRAGFNVVTWRDPMLTFWLSLICGILSIILFFFPWRIFLFIVGVALVGPHNWVIRILREQGRLPPAPKYSSKKENVSAADDDDFSELPTDRPVFTRDCRRSGNEPMKPVDSSVDPREIHHVVVPYGPLCHQRCNDWPPEPQYARVERKTDGDASKGNLAGAVQFRRPASFGSEHSSAGESTNRFGRLRRRLRTKRSNA